MDDRGRLLILGGTGKLGTALARRLEADAEAFVAPGRAEADLLGADIEALLDEIAPAAVINAAAYNDVDGAGREPGRELAVRLNTDVPRELARGCARRAIALVHVSTDYVFDGRASRPYTENDPADPLQFYGRTKLEGERAVLASHPGAVVARTSTLFGTDRRGGSNFIAAVLARARASPVLEVVRRPVSSPTYAPDLAGWLIELLLARAKGLVHVVNAGGCSRLELAAETLRLAGFDRRVELRERSEPPAAAPRPAYSVLDTARFTQLGGRRPRPWQDALRDYVTEPGSSGGR